MTADREPVRITARDIRVGDRFMPEGLATDGTKHEVTSARNYSGSRIEVSLGDWYVTLPAGMAVWVLRERPKRTVEVIVPDGHIAVVIPTTTATRYGVRSWTDPVIADACRKALAAEGQ